MKTHVAIIGAGPAGLTAAYLLAKENIAVTVFEADPIYVGGIARTVRYKEYCFDIGGHRFFSKAEEVEAFWAEMLPDDMLERPRRSRIFYREQFFSYPLKAFEALRKLGLIESTRCVLSYLKAKVRPVKTPINFSEWVTNQFGKRLFQIFFKTYTEKVWGMPCEAISADWAAQRIKGLSMLSAIINAIKPKKWRNKQKTIKTLIDTFRYPRKGPGMLWEACAEKIKNQHGQILMGSEVRQCNFDEEKNTWEICFRNSKGQTETIFADHLISSAPMRELALNYLSPALSKEAQLSAMQLQYRDFLIVVLILKDKNLFNDNWIYVHEAKVDVARIQNFKSWSPDMVPNAHTCCYGLEYFCFKDDSLWAAQDEVLLKKATAEIVSLGLAKAEDVLDGCVVRQPKAYPVYDNDYQNHVAALKTELEEKFKTLHLVGRNGMHKYNNQDHAMMTAMLTVKNILAGKREFDVWCVNQDAEYIESGNAGAQKLWTGLREVPRKI